MGQELDWHYRRSSKKPTEKYISFYHYRHHGILGDLPRKEQQGGKYRFHLPRDDPGTEHRLEVPEAKDISTRH